MENSNILSKLNMYIYLDVRLVFVMAHLHWQIQAQIRIANMIATL